MSNHALPSALKFAPVILAGGSGTRFWPRSRRSRAKQVLALDGERSMIQQTMDRLLPLADAASIWVITNDLLVEQIARQMPELPAEHLLCEPAARNTAPACALAAFLLERDEPETVIGIFPSDHVVRQGERFTEVVQAGIALAASGDRIVVLGVPPTRAETGYGYIELGAALPADAVPTGGIPVRRVRRFTEKPDAERARGFVATGNYAWNSGIFLWSAKTLADAIREHCPAIAPRLAEIAASYGTAQFPEVFARVYPECQSISIDYAVLEPRSAKGERGAEIYCLPADFGWNDLGSWNALYDHHSSYTEQPETLGSNVLDAVNGLAIEAGGNYVYAPERTVALLGVADLVVVVTEDAVLVTTRERSQEVGAVTRALAEAGRSELL